MVILRMSSNYLLKTGKDMLEFSIFILFASLFIAFFLTALDFVGAFISLEGLSFTLYILAAMNLTSQSSVEAAVKYFCLGGLSSGILLFGISLIYGVWGSTNFMVIRSILRSSSLS